MCISHNAIRMRTTLLIQRRECRKLLTMHHSLVNGENIISWQQFSYMFFSTIITSALEKIKTIARFKEKNEYVRVMKLLDGETNE